MYQTVASVYNGIQNYLCRALVASISTITCYKFNGDSSFDVIDGIFMGNNNKLYLGGRDYTKTALLNVKLDLATGSSDWRMRFTNAINTVTLETSSTITFNSDESIAYYTQLHSNSKIMFYYCNTTDGSLIKAFRSISTTSA